MEIHIGGRSVGDGHPVYIIAEIGVNHNGLLELALKLVDAAVEAGADAVKFQKRNLKQLFPAKFLSDPNTSEKSLRYLIPILQRVELADEDYHEVTAYCKNKGITFLCTPFDHVSADFVDSLGVPAFKVASADLTNWPLLECLIQKGKPLILSTGMSTMVELTATVEFLKSQSAQFALLHCNSTYPAPFENINLRFMERLRDFGVPVGYSGHERGITVSTVAAALGACIIERHLTFDRTMDGPDHAASLEPHGFRKMVRDIHHTQAALGTGDEKFLSMGEIANREVLAKSLMATRRIMPGETITREMVTVKGPGTDLSPQMLPQLLGRVAERVIELDEPFLSCDLGQVVPTQLERTLPLKWGFVARFRDMHEILALQPHCLEFHFTDHDLDDPFPGGTFEQVLIVHAPEFWERTLVDLCTHNEAQRTDSVRLIQRSIDKARGMAPHFAGVPKVVVHPGAMHIDHQIFDVAALEANLLRSISELDYQGVELLLENLPPRPWYFGGQWTTSYFMDADEIERFCRSTDLKICFDICHAKLYCNWAHRSLAEQTERLLPYTSHLHISDAAGIDGEGLQIGEGGIDFVQFFRQLGGSYIGTLVPEIWRGHQNNAAGFIIAIERMANAFYRAQGRET